MTKSLDLPFYINFVFITSLLFTLVLFLRAVNFSKWVIWGITVWIVIQGSMAYSGFYLKIAENPQKMLLPLLPVFVVVLTVFISKSGKKWVRTINLKLLTLLQTVRIPIEMVLYWLFLHNLVPELMTFNGRNFDILAGITAPLVYYLGFVKNKMGRKSILIWNLVSLFLLLNIVTNAILSAASPFQQFAFDQPNKALFYFPYIWLPSVIVPIALFSHLACIYNIHQRKIGSF